MSERKVISAYSEEHKALLMRRKTKSEIVDMFFEAAKRYDAQLSETCCQAMRAARAEKKCREMECRLEEMK